VIHGEAGNACPYCGCAKLNRLEEHGVPGARLHVPVVRLALAFCVGLMLMQVFLLWPDFNLSSGRALPFWQLNLLIGICTGVYLLLRPRTFQVIMGLTLISYAVNLFIFSMGRIKVDSEPVLVPGVAATLANTADPMPQALVLTAIVIGFAMTALFLVVLLASRGLSGTDHVDGEKKELAE